MHHLITEQHKWAPIWLLIKELYSAVSTTKSEVSGYEDCHIVSCLDVERTIIFMKHLWAYIFLTSLLALGW